MSDLKCPVCGEKIELEDGRSSAICKNCGCEIKISVSVSMPKETSEGGTFPEGETENLPESDAPAQGGEVPGKPKPMINVFGPAAIALGALTIVFAFLAGINALVLGICGIIASILGFLMCFLIKEVKKWMPVAGIILNILGIIISIIIKDGFVF